MVRFAGRLVMTRSAIGVEMASPPLAVAARTAARSRTLVNVQSMSGRSAVSSTRMLPASAGTATPLQVTVSRRHASVGVEGGLVSVIS